MNTRTAAIDGRRKRRGGTSPSGLKFPLALDVYNESDAISCYRSGIADSDGSDCILHWGLLAAWKYMKEVPDHGPSLDVERLKELMVESIVGSLTRKLERSDSAGSLIELTSGPASNLCASVRWIRA